MLAIVPVNVMVAVPLAPAVKVRPVVLDRVAVPLVLANCTWAVLAPASTSLIEMALALPVESTLAVFTCVDWVAGTVLTGASLTAVMVMLRVAAALVAVPSLVTKDTVRVVVTGFSLVLA